MQGGEYRACSMMGSRLRPIGKRFWSKNRGMGGFMSTLDEYAQLVSSIYDAALDFKKWPTVIERLSDALSGNGGGIATHNLVTGAGAVVMARRDPIFTRLYDEHYRKVNVLFDRVGRVPAETCMTDRDVMPKEELFRTEF